MAVKGKPRRHPGNHTRNGQNLEHYVFNRIDGTHNEFREELIAKYTYIDQQVNNYLRLSDDDRKRMQDRLEGKSVKPTDVSLPFVFTQLDDAVTFMMQVFSPNSKIFDGVGENLPNQKAINAFVDLMNNHASTGQYYRHIVRAVFSGLKYNIGGLESFWQEIRGNVAGNREDGELDIQQGALVQAYNRLQAVDPYNFLWDTNCDVVDIPRSAEWVATIGVKTRFYLERLKEAGLVYNLDEVEALGQNYINEYYRPRPITREYLRVQDENEGSTNWMQFMREIQSERGGQNISLSGKYELLMWTGWLRPSDFGLGPDNSLRIWRLMYAITGDNSRILIWDSEMKNVHNMLPFCMNMPIETELGLDQKSYGENLMPFQVFSSFLLNTHQRALRKALYGITVYDPNAINLSQLGDDVVGKVPYNPNIYNRPIDTVIRQYFDAPGTEGNIIQIDNIQQLMQYILPTDQRRSSQDLQRATSYQAMASVQGHNARSYKIAHVIDGQMFTPLKDIMLSNIQQYQTTVEIINQKGEPVEIDPKEFREGRIYYNIGGSLKGLDKLLVINTLREILVSVIQNKDAAARIDVVGLMNYISTLTGEETDLTKYEKSNEEVAALQQALGNAQPPGGQGGPAGPVTA